MPLFPLGTVLFPGLVLPLHIFEERYLALVRHIQQLPADQPREFGVVAIARGWEVEGHRGEPTVRGEPAVPGELTLRGEPTLHPVGCTAEVRRITQRQDGRYDLVTVGRRRFAVAGVDASSEGYLVADVDWIEEATGSDMQAQRLAAGVLALFQRYLHELSPDRPGEQLPEDPTVLSHLVAATAALPLEERQALLAAVDTPTRLRTELVLLRREVELLRQIRAVPVPLTELAVRSRPN
jgi:Lon protease-like protein